MTTTTATSARASSRLDDSQLRSWHDDGFVLLRRFFSAREIAAAAEEAEDLLQRHRGLIDTKNMRCRFQPNVKTGECEFECFDPVIDLSLACHQLALNPRLLNVLGDLYGEEACLFKDKLIFKPPGVKGYDLHQDFISWPTFPPSFLTVLVPFDRADEDNGCTVVYPGYHHNGLLTPADGQYHPLPAGTVDASLAVPMVLDPGDIAIFGGFTPHRSDPNRSDRWRRQLYLSYNKISEGGHQRPQHYREFHLWLRQKYAEHGKSETYFC
jgi:2-aminoethylphosphonate dioxygenase